MVDERRQDADDRQCGSEPDQNPDAGSTPRQILNEHAPNMSVAGR